MSSVVYWIRNEDHTDMFTQGYIGVSSQVEKRWEYHKKHGENNHLRNSIKLYGWDKLVKQVLLVSDLAYCLMIESQLRAEDKIGWNVVKGGGHPPSTPWNKGKKLAKEIYDTLHKKGFGFDKGNVPWNKGVKYTSELKDKIFDIAEHVKQNGHWSKKHPMEPKHYSQLFKTIECPHCNKVGYIGNMNRYHMDKCKFKEN